MNDSKKLSTKKRKSLYLDIQKFSSLTLHRFVSHRYIDSFGISKAIFEGILSLKNKSRLSSPLLLIDGNYNFTSKDPEGKLQYRSIVKGDEKIASIAAASIIAKENRDDYMIELAKLYPEYSFEKHKGYGTELHRKKIKELGYSKVHRKSFQIK
ncbi:MAG: ribonuclease HII [Leptospiraceae bacterium]|nr:ribonuclease HII [Leptospiraceae bacterium]